MMPCSLVAYDASGRVIATLDHLVRYGPNGEAHLRDFAGIEASGAPLRLRADGSAGVWAVAGAVGSGTWPEWLGLRAHEFEVIVDDARPARIRGLRHIGDHATAASGLVRDRDLIEGAIDRRLAEAGTGPAYIGDIVGGPLRPLHLDAEGRTITALRDQPRGPDEQPGLIGP